MDRLLRIARALRCVTGVGRDSTDVDAQSKLLEHVEHLPDLGGRLALLDLHDESHAGSRGSGEVGLAKPLGASFRTNKGPEGLGACDLGLH